MSRQTRYAARKRNRRKAGGRCVTCGALVENGAYRCDACRAKHRLESADAANQRAGAGLCTRCGKPMDSDKYRTCAECRSKRNAMRSDVPRIESVVTGKKEPILGGEVTEVFFD